MFSRTQVLHQKPYNTKADVWSLGATLYAVANNGKLLFGPTGNASHTMTAGAGLWQPPPLPEHAPKAEYDLLFRMLKVDPAARASAEELLRDPLFAELRGVVGERGSGGGGECVGDRNGAALIVAAKAGDVATVANLLKNGANIEATDDDVRGLSRCCLLLTVGVLRGRVLDALTD